MIKSGSGPTVNHRDDLILVKINHAEANRQISTTTWAKPLGGDLYEITRALDLISGFDVGDVVRAIGSSQEPTPIVIEMVRKGGYKTLHIAFVKGLAISSQEEILKELEKWKATYEMAFDRFYTVVVPPEGSFETICQYLKSFVRTNTLRYEPEMELSQLIRFRFLE